MQSKNNLSDHDLTTGNWGNIRKQQFSVVLLPWGATEPHNYHLPYLTDCYLSHAVAKDCADYAYTHLGVNAMVMPPVPFGAQNPGQWNKPFCIHTRVETQKAILQDIVHSLYVQGFRNLIIINGHGGNTFKPLIRDLAFDMTDFRIAAVDWWTILPHHPYFEELPDEHAGELETSVMLHYYPELIDMTTAGDGAVKPFDILSVENKTAWMPRHWDKISADTGIGNPHKATAEKGERYVADVVPKIAKMIAELAERGNEDELGVK